MRDEVWSDMGGGMWGVGGAGVSGGMVGGRGTEEWRAGARGPIPSTEPIARSEYCGERVGVDVECAQKREEVRQMMC